MYMYIYVCVCIDIYEYGHFYLEDCFSYYGLLFTYEVTYKTEIDPQT